MKKILLILSLLTLSASANDCYSFFKVSDFKKSSECYSKLIKKDNSFNNNYYLGLSF